MDLSAVTDFFLTMISLIYCKVHYLYQPMFYLVCDLIYVRFFLKIISNCNAFSVFQSKNLNPLLNLLINCISAKSVSQILSIKGECTFRLWKFLIIGLCSSSANYLLEIFSFCISGINLSLANNKLLTISFFFLPRIKTKKELIKEFYSMVSLFLN